MVTVDFEGLEDLSPAELSVALIRFRKQNKYAADGRAGGRTFNGLLTALDEERERRRATLAQLNADLLDDDGDYEWTPDA